MRTLKQFNFHRGRVTNIRIVGSVASNGIDFISSSLDYSVRKTKNSGSLNWECESEQLYSHRGGVEDITLFRSESDWDGMVFSAGRDCYIRSHNWSFRFSNAIKQLVPTHLIENSHGNMIGTGSTLLANTYQ